MTRRAVSVLAAIACVLPAAADAQDEIAPSEAPFDAPEDADPDAVADTDADADADTDAETDADAGSEDDLQMGDILVQARVEDLFRAGGSVHEIGEPQLQRLSYNDPGSVLTQVPGVYVRSEEGYGLRPNIGLRGASAERSRRITLMEDGVLLAPAPYAAPAAYYFPLMARMTGVEVSAGPAAILYGPNTIGGAIDLRGRRIPARREGRVDLSLGNTWYGRAHVHYGDSNEWGGFVAELLHLRTSGFHELDAPPGVSTDTGFHRTDVLLRGDLHGSIDAEWYHRVEATFGLGLEQSNETYLGLTDADFRANPYRRYAATQLDRMEWWRTRAQLRYEIYHGEDFQLAVTAYRHDFQRTWYRADHFCDNPTRRPATPTDTCGADVGFDAILSDPQTYSTQYERLTGTLEPEAGDSPILVVRNHRVFAVQGLQANGSASFETGPFSHRVQFGARVHFDEITRVHTGDTYFLRQGRMVLEDANLELEGNHDSAWAFAAYASWAVTWEHLTIAPGVRTEMIWTHHEDRYTGDVVDGEQLALLPGLGAQYALTDDLALFAGAHLGFSPVAPGQPAEVLPETAWNYEVGGRYGRVTDPTHGQLAYFLSDYENMTSVCTLASGCSDRILDRQFNAGAATIMGVEADVAHTIVVDELQIPLAASYTWTWTRLSTRFTSDNPQFGAVEPGYQLPYVPEHQLSVRAGMTFRFFQLQANGVFGSEMRDRAGQGPVDPGERTDAYFLLDAMASVEVLPGFRIYLRGENLTDARPILTRRAWGARGARPVLVQGGIQLDIR
jgi:Fe(3+) dicitrate transport protein